MNCPSARDMPVSNAEIHMQRALELARRGEGRTRPNPPVGAVIVRKGELVGEGFHPRAGEPHAEIFALRQAGDRARGADLYVTLEPCIHHGRTGPCTEAITAAGIARVFVGTVDPNPQVGGRGVERLREAGIAVRIGILAAQCRRLIAPFAKHVTTGLPYVVLKSAVTLDGRTATGNGDSKWITGEESRLEVHRLRDRLDAVMVGIGTVLRDDPRLTVRLPEGGRDPWRIVVDSRLRLSADAALLCLDSEAPTLIATTAAADPDKVHRLEEKGARILRCAEQEGRVDLADLLRKLGSMGLQSILLEGGAALNGHAWRQGLVDRVMVFIAPKILGGDDGPGIFAGPGVDRIAAAMALQDLQVRRFGGDVLLEGEVEPCSPD